MTDSLLLTNNQTFIPDDRTVQSNVLVFVPSDDGGAIFTFLVFGRNRRYNRSRHNADNIAVFLVLLQVRELIKSKPTAFNFQRRKT